MAAVVGVQLDIRDKHIVGDGRLADHVAVLKAAGIGVVIRNELELVAGLPEERLVLLHPGGGLFREIVRQGGHALCHGQGHLVVINLAEAGDLPALIRAVPAQQDIHPLAVQQGGDIAGDDHALACADGQLVIEGHGLVVDGQPVAALRRHEIALVVKLEDGIEAKVYIAGAVIIEQVVVQALDQGPLLFREGNDVLAVGVLGPDERGGVKAVLRDIAGGLLLAEAAVEREAGAVAAAEEGADELIDQLFTAGRRGGVAAGQNGRDAVAADTGAGLTADLEAGEGADAVGIALIHADGVVGIAGLVHPVGLAVREIDGKAVGIGNVGRGPVVLDGLGKGPGELGALGGAEIPRKVDQVDLVDHGAARKLAGAVAGAGNLLIPVGLDHGGHGLGKLLQRGGDRIRKLCQVDDGKRGALAAGLLGAGGDEVIHDVFADLDRGHGRIRAEPVQPVGIVPADARLGLLGGNEVVGIAVQHKGSLEGRHEAGVKADEVEGDAAVLQGLVDALEGHAAAALILFVIAEAGDGAAAVVPENQLIAVSGKVLGAVLDKGGQGRRIRHGLGAHVALEALETAGLDLIDLVAVGCDDGVVPAGAAAGIDDDADIVRKARFGHLDKVPGRHAAAGLEIRAAHIDHDGDPVLPAAENGSALIAGFRRDRGVDGGGVGVRGMRDRGGGSKARRVDAVVVGRRGRALRPGALGGRGALRLRRGRRGGHSIGRRRLRRVARSPAAGKQPPAEDEQQNQNAEDGNTPAASDGRPSDGRTGLADRFGLRDKIAGLARTDRAGAEALFLFVYGIGLAGHVSLPAGRAIVRIHCCSPL